MEESKDLPIILFEHTDICNSGHLVISDLNMRILPGEFVYIIGKVGSGKTSIIRTIIGEIPVSKGTAMAGRIQSVQTEKTPDTISAPQDRSGLPGLPAAHGQVRP